MYTFQYIIHLANHKNLFVVSSIDINILYLYHLVLLFIHINHHPQTFQVHSPR